ncbi:hypothetical protein [Sagittula salina]|nr:hypothetical protein [Sagittula salina]
MKAMFLGILASALIGFGAWYVLNTLEFSTAETHAEDASVRLN